MTIRGVLTVLAGVLLAWVGLIVLWGIALAIHAWSANRISDE